MESRSVEMKWIQLISIYDRLPENYTGMVDYWIDTQEEKERSLAETAYGKYYHRVFKYVRQYLINGVVYKIRFKDGVVVFYSQNRPATFEEMFSGMNEEAKEVVAWNWDVWRN